MPAIQLPEDVKKILYRLSIHGHRAYVVGGCVRDSLMGVTPHDWDICTSAKPDEVKQVFARFRLIETGMKHGTVTVLVNDVPYEITTFRIDGTYSDGRHPDSVSFTKDIEADLSRRDFTMNAMAYNDEEGLIDPFGGRNDIATGTICCVGNARERFEEDPLRILRAMRFASTLGFDVAPYTAVSMLAAQELLLTVSAERIQSEMCKLIMGRDAMRVLSRHSPQLCTIIPEFAPCIGFNQRNRWHAYTVFDHILRAVDAYKGGDLITRLALLFHDIGKPRCFTFNETGGHFYGHPAVSAQMTDEILQRLRFDNQTRRDVVQLVKEHDRTFAPTRKSVRKLLNQIGTEQARRLMDIRRADIAAQRQRPFDYRVSNLAAFEALLDTVIREGDCVSLKDLAVNGNDLKALGLEGKAIGETLRRLLELVMAGSLENTKDSLLTEAAWMVGDM